MTKIKVILSTGINGVNDRIYPKELLKREIERYNKALKTDKKNVLC